MREGNRQQVEYVRYSQKQKIVNYKDKTMKATIRKTIQLLFIALVLASCSKSGDEPTPTEIQTDVYVIGHKNVAGRGNTGTIWKNGTLLYTFPEAEVFGIYVSGEDVYVAGSVYNDRRVAMLWKNGSPQELTDGSGDAGATSVYVAGTDVYVAGLEYKSSLGHVAKVWKNGVAQELTDGSTRNSYAGSVYVSGTDVYVAGYVLYGTLQACTVWKNSIAHKLTDGSTSAVAKSVYVSGGDVYVAGFERSGSVSVAKLWKNGTPQDLTNGAHSAFANSVYASGTDVYVAGYERYGSSDNAVAKLWKNGIAQDLANRTSYSEANSVFVSGGDAYVAGWEYNNEVSSAKVWKNGEVLYDLPTLGEEVRPTGVFVVQTEK